MQKNTLIIIALLAMVYWWMKVPSYRHDASQITLKYHIRYPAGGSHGDSMPLMIALHGNGDTYDNFYEYTLKDFPTSVRVVLIEAPKKYWPYDLNRLEKYSSAIASLSGFLTHKYTTQGEPILFGFSGGGVMAYFSALNHCDSYSTIVPVSDKLEAAMLPSNITTSDDCHVLAFHGQSDGVVSYSGGLFAINLLKKHSNEVQLISFDGGHHGIFKEQKKMIQKQVVKIL